MKLNYCFMHSVFIRRLMMLLAVLVITFGISIEAVAKKDFELIGKIEIGDSDEDAIHPRFMLNADGTDSEGLLLNPTPVNPIHFHLSEDIELNKIELKDIDDASAQLYFVIWNSSGEVVVNLRSYLKNGQEHAGHGHAEKFGEIELAAGHYRFAVVGQCFNPGGQPKEWSDKCQTNSNWNYDGFEFQDIKLKTKSGTSKSIALIERRHIGDTDERDDGYEGRWYPDEPTDEVSHDDHTHDFYKFDVEKDADLNHLIMYNYRDVNPQQSNVTFILRGEGPDREHTMDTEGQSSGNYTWVFDPPLTKKGKYELEIKTHDVKGLFDLGPDLGIWGILTDNDDDISWDDIVITAEPDVPPPVNVNHYRISHPGNALTCESTSAVILACSENSSSGNCGVATDYSGDVIVQVDGNSETVTLSAGTGLLSGLEKLSPGSVALSFRDNQTYCNQDTADQTSCDISFANIGLQFSQQINSDADISNQVAGTANNSLYLRALQSDGNGTCSVLDTDSNEFKLGYECISPMVCDDNVDINYNFKVGNTPLNDVTETPVTLAKAATGVYKVHQPVYPNAGLIRLSASYVFEDNSTGESPETLVTDSNSFAVRPDKFNIKATRYDGLASTDLTERSGNGLMHTHKAEQTFSFAIQAVNANGDITTNYVPDNSKLRIKLTRSIPVADDGFEGLFSYAEGLTLSTTPASSSDWIEMPNLPSFDSGVYSFEDAMYSEVGAIKINVKDDDYHNMQFSADEDFADDTKGPEIGRFIPSHFTLVSSRVDNYVGSRSSIRSGYDYIFPEHLADYVAGTKVLQEKDGLVYQCREFPNSGYCVQWNEGSNQYEPGVGSAWQMAWSLLDEPAGGAIFTYMDQPELAFHYYLEAQNAENLVTKNYLGANEGVTFIANADDQNYSERLADFAGNWCEGIYQPNSCDNMASRDPDLGMFTRLPSGEDGPIMNTFFGIQVSDPDGVELTDLDLPVGNAPTAKNLDVEASELRYGRWFIFNGSGPTGSEFPVTMQLQYYDGATDTFIKNPDDSITEFTAADARAEINGNAAGLTLTGSGGFNAGETRALMISSTNPGAAILEYINTPPWLQYDWSGNGQDDDMPQATINFGFFYGNDRVIYRRRLN